jgi:hypothetical protein
MPAPALGATQVTVTSVPALVRATLGLAGWPGGPAVLGSDAVLAVESPVWPTPFATTWNVYAWPLVRPLTTQLVAPEPPVQPALDGEEVTV